jgi:hypothetical protein
MRLMQERVVGLFRHGVRGFFSHIAVMFALISPFV